MSKGWRGQLEEQGPGDPHAGARTRLRSASMLMDERASQLAAEINRDLPDFACHDHEHHEALWEYAELIGGAKLELNPAEIFVLHGAICVHDLGLGAAAYPNGLGQLRSGTAWEDAVALAYRDRYRRAPSRSDITESDSEVTLAATRAVLIEQHAKRGEDLALVHWTTPDGEQLYLIEETEIRRRFGQLIGRIAYSHWWPLSRVRREFHVESLGTPTWLPNEWTIDPLKLACLLRTADACHLDARRAPTFLHAVRQPQGVSEDHWRFQELVDEPIVVQGDRLQYSSGSPFRKEDAKAWRLGYELLDLANKELRAVDTLLSNERSWRFQVRSVVGVEDPALLAELIQVEGWEPRDTRFKVIDIPEMVRELGGEQLYGPDKLAALRELLQNAMDAIRARRKLESHLPPDWGTIVVRISSDGTHHWLEVEDNGVGMSLDVMSTALVNWMESFWNTPAVAHEFPGLASSGFQPTGRYGIGFYAAFMLGTHVTVTSRRADGRPDETHLLEFMNGVDEPPIPSLAAPEEWRHEGGTLVRVLLADPPTKGGLPYASNSGQTPTLNRLCSFIAPASDITIEVEEEGQRSIAVKANDWLTISSLALLLRLREPRWGLGPESEEENAPNLTIIEDADGHVVGRAAMGTELYATDVGAVVEGGLRVIGLKQIAGILTGRVERISRDAATPQISRAELSRWASHQATLIAKQDLDERQRRAAAWAIYLCGGDPGDLPVAESANGPLTYDELIEWARGRKQVLVVGEMLYDAYAHAEIELLPDTIATPINLNHLFLQGRQFSEWPLTTPASKTEMRAADPVHSAVSTAWDEIPLNRTSGRRTATKRDAFKIDGQPVPTDQYQLYVGAATS